MAPFKVDPNREITLKPSYIVALAAVCMSATAAAVGLHRDLSQQIDSNGAQIDAVEARARTIAVEVGKRHEEIVERLTHIEHLLMQRAQRETP